MKYLFLLNSPNDGLPDRSTPEFAQLLHDFRAATDAMASAGVLLECAPLLAASTSTTVRVRADEVLLTDGPAAELREQVGGYALLDCADLDEALKWAATFPNARTGSVEVRTVIQVSEPA